MKKKYYFIILTLIIVGGLIVGLQQKIWPFNDKKETANIPVGTAIGNMAPDFTLQLLNGEEIKLSDLRGKKVFLNFWATWCPPCQAEMPEIQKFYQNHKEVAILGVNVRENRGTVAEYLMLNGYHFPVALDKAGDVATEYQVRGIPTTYFLNEEGVIINKYTGPLNYQQILKFLEIQE